MADFTREEVIQVVEGGRKCVGADLRNIDLSDADLRKANLRGANLTGAIYCDSYLPDCGADFNPLTKWPEGFDPVAAGAVLYT